MKKSIKKACALALVATSATALVGTNAVVFANNTNTNNNAVYAATLTASDLKIFEVDGNSSVAYVGSQYTIPTATFSGATGDITTTVTGPIGETVKVTDGKFDVNSIGTYTITYSYTDATTKTYTATYNVEAQVGENKIVVTENTNRILPKYVYQSYNGAIYVPTATVEFEDGKDVEYTITTTVTSPKTHSKLTVEADGKLSGYTELEEGTYSVRYDAKTVAEQGKESIYLNTKTVEFTVLADKEFEKEYGKDYELKFEYSKTAPTTADIGQEVTLPTPVGKMGSEEVPVYYTIEAYLFVDGKEVNVTTQTIDGNKFTAKKSYTVDGTTYNADNASYQFYYNVKDALGVAAEKSGFMISGVKDTKEPEIIIADPYNAENPGEVKDVEYKLQSNFVNGENVVIKAIYATDAADDNVTLTRYIRKDTQSSTEEDIYNDSKDGNPANSYAKDIVFNRTRELTENEIDGGELQPGTYKVYYKAVDSAGNSNIVNYSFTVSSTFAFDKKPTVEFTDEFLTTVKNNDVVKFAKPEAASEQDERLNTYVMYKFDNDAEWTVLTEENIGKDGKYFVTVNKEGAKTLTLRAVTESDAADDFDVTSDDVSAYGGYRYAFDEHTFMIVDNTDATPLSIVSMDSLEASYQQNTDVVLPRLELSDDLVDYLTVDIYVNHEGGQALDVENAVVLKTFDSDKKAGTYVLTNATFYATLAGKYDIVYEITDAGNNKAFIYLATEVTENTIVSEPAFGKLPEALNEGKLELGESITLPVPEYPEGYHYTVNVRGPVGSKLTKEIFTPKKVGTYTLVYDLYETSSGTIKDTKEFKVEVKDTTAPEVRVEWNLENSYKAGTDTKVLIPVFSASDISGINLEESKIVISSKSYSRTIKGSEMKDLLDKYNEYLEDNTKDPGNLLVTLRYNEEYKVTYTVYDNSTNKNSTTQSYTIKVGDLVAPVIDVEDNIVASTQKINQNLVIDVSKIDLLDNETATGDIKLKITVKNTTTGAEIKNIYEEEDGKFEYAIDTAGEYTVTFKATDAVGNEKTITRTFTVNEENNQGMETNEVIAIVACCVAVLILAGAIVYMVVTKKKIQSYK